MGNITKTISFTIPDLQMAYDLHWSKKQPVRKNLYLIIAVISFLLWLFTDYAAPVSTEKSAGFWTALQFFFLFYSILCVGLHFWWYRNYAKRMAKKAGSIGKEFIITFSSAGVKAVSANASSDTLWAVYTEAIMNDQIILLYRTPMLFNYYPRRLFTWEEYQVIRDWIKENVKVLE